MRVTDDGFKDHFYRSGDGLRLHARIYGDATPGVLPVICLPGLTRNARDFHRLAVFLATKHPVGRQVVAFDYRGRGQSAHDGDWRNYTVATELQDMLLGLASLGIDRAFFIGTSRGGLILQVLAVVRPDIIAGTVLNDIGPVLEKRGLDEIRHYLDASPGIDSFEDAIKAQKKFHAAAFPALDDSDWVRMTRAIYRMEDGRPVADHDPALGKTLTTLDPDQPLPQLWKEFDALARMPVLAIRGENSMLFSEDTLLAMAGRGPAVETITVAGQGHPPLLETAGLPDRIASFFARIEAQA